VSCVDMVGLYPFGVPKVTVADEYIYVSDSRTFKRYKLIFKPSVNNLNLISTSVQGCSVSSMSKSCFKKCLILMHFTIACR